MSPDSFQIRAQLAWVKRRRAFKLSSRNIEKPNRKIELSQPRQAIRKMIDGVIFLGQGTMPARIGNFQPEAEKHFLCCLHTHEYFLAVLDHASAAVGVYTEFSIDQIAMVLHQPVDSVRSATLLVRSQRED